MQDYNMVAVQNLYLAFYVMAVINEPLKVGCEDFNADVP
jgi:hypothetical protein